MSKNNTNNNGSNSAIARIKKRSMLKKQRLAILFISLSIVLLAVALAVVCYFAEIYQFSDVDGKEYDIKKVNGIYQLCRKSGEVLYKNEDGYYQTDSGSLVYIDTKTGEYKTKAIVDTFETEQEYYSTVLLFPGMTYDQNAQKDKSKVISKIEIFGENSSYTVKRVSKNTFALAGYEQLTLNTEKFASLATVCGSVMSSLRLNNPVKLADGSVDLSEYGLVAETRVRIETDEDGNEVEVEYQYEPTYFVITAENGDWHKIIIGDQAVTGTERYMLYAGGESFDSKGNKTVHGSRDKIYVVDSQANLLGYSAIEDYIMGSVEKLLTPTIVYPMGMTDYFNVKDFIIRQDIDYDAILADLTAKYGDPDSIEDGSVDLEEFYAYYNELLDKYGKKVCHFTYRDMEEREGSMYSYLPYESLLEYAGGYYLNSNTIDTVLAGLYDTEFGNVVKLHPDDGELEKYGLDSAKYILSYNFKVTDADGKVGYVENSVKISEKNKNGIFYAYSETYDMIVEVMESSFGFLEYEEIEWYDPSYIQLDLAYVETIRIESQGFTVEFKIDKSASSFMSYIEQSGSKFSDGKNSYKIEKDGNGKYVLVCNETALEAIYKGDFLITPLPYVEGVAQSNNFLFVESKKLDSDGDGNSDTAAYYYYNIAYYRPEIYGGSGKEGYVMIEDVILADLNGNKLGQKGDWLKSYYETDYFVTNSGYVYIASKDTFVGGQLDERYGSLKRGEWHHGNVFVTADGNYVLVDSKTGEWSSIDKLEGDIFFADKTNSRFALRAVEIPAKYNSSGKITRYLESYYPTTAEKLQYDEKSGKIQVYNTAEKAWETASYTDCTIGIWCKGAYYITENGTIIAVNEETGDWGIVKLQTNQDYVADIFANGELLDYTIKTTNHMGKLVNTSALTNFKQLYSAMLYASLEGMAELTDEEMALLKAMDNFSAGGSDNPCQLKITIMGEDYKGNRRDTVYRFYQYTERKSYITIEALYEEDGFASDSNTAYSSFYVLRTYADKIIEDAKKMVAAEEIDAITKY